MRLILQPDVTGDAERWRVRRQALRSTLFGLVLAVIGGGVLIGMINNVGLTGKYLLYAVMSFIFGLIALAFGLMLVVERSGFDFDRRRGTLITWTSYFLFQRQREYALDRFDGLLLTRYWLFNRIARDVDHYHYRLAVRAADVDQRNIELGHTLHPENAKDVAERLAGFLGLPVEEVKGRAEGILAGR